MNYITKITTYQLGKDRFEYRGTLMNQFVFKMGEKVFFTLNKYSTDMLAFGVIVGILSSASENPEYEYTIRVDQSIINGTEQEKDTFSNIKCDSIFRTIEEAKKSARYAIDKNYKLSKEYIERFFKQFE